MGRALQRTRKITGTQKMSQYDEKKCLEMSQAITEIYQSADASLAEICSATALALRVALDLHGDRIMRGYLISQVIKHLTMDHKTEEVVRPAIEIIRPNGHS